MAVAAGGICLGSRSRRGAVWGTGADPLAEGPARAWLLPQELEEVHLDFISFLA